ncbi:MAG: hypothetical protein Q4C01_08160 [Clostridia bacterium]|nr:hypothetical protein [Clostridia bacterium]
MEQRDFRLIHTEQSLPQRKRIRSDGILYLLLLFAVLLIIWFCNRFASVLPIPSGYVQLILYALLLVCAILVIRYRLTGFRYTLTDTHLCIDKLIGHRETNLLMLPLDKLTAVGACDKGVKSPRLYVGKRKDATCITVDGKAYLISPGPELKEKLIELAR